MTADEIKAALKKQGNTLHEAIAMTDNNDDEDVRLLATTGLNPSASDQAKIDELAQRLNQAEDRKARETILGECEDPQIGFAAIREASRQRLQAQETTPALTLLDFGCGEWAVTLNDYGGPDGDDVSSVRVFQSKEEAEAFISECRAHNDLDAEPAHDGDDNDPGPW